MAEASPIEPVDSVLSFVESIGVKWVASLLNIPVI
jgi:hypothetical protein